jgi:hypothetical protein
VPYDCGGELAVVVECEQNSLDITTRETSFFMP